MIPLVFTEETARSLYPDCEPDELADYDPIIDAIGRTIAEQTSPDSYSGDTFRPVVGADDRIGLLQVSWGSCSGCDALQACNSWADVAELAQQIYDEVKWFDTLVEAKTYVRDDFARALQAAYYSGDWSPFVAAVDAL